jgi:hypothetical protein
VSDQADSDTPATSDDARGSGGLERVTPRIDTRSRCRCDSGITWDEVYGWLHTDAGRPSCAVPTPANGRLRGWSGTAAARTA